MSPYAVQMDGLHDNLVKQIRRLARRNRWSMNRTADAAGVSRSGLSNIMNKRKSPTLETVEKLAIAFEVPAAELLRNSEAERTRPALGANDAPRTAPTAR